jgi:hypothetical protein
MDLETLSIQPTETRSAEAVWLWMREHDGLAPLWEDAVQELVEYIDLDADTIDRVDDAEVRLLRAIRDEEIVPVPVCNATAWIVKLDQVIADTITLRYMEVSDPFEEADAE